MDALELRGMLWRAWNDLQHLENAGPRTGGPAAEKEGQSPELTMAAEHIAGGAACIKQALAAVGQSPEFTEIQRRIKGEQKA